MKTLFTSLLFLVFNGIQILQAQTFTPVRKVVIEDQTISATGWGIFCPRGIVRIDSFEHSSSSDMAEIISVHANFNSPPDPMDSMYNHAYYDGCFNSQNPNWTRCNAWPQLMFDRKTITNPDSIFYFYNQHIGDFGVADIDVSPVYNSTTRELDVTVTTHFAVDVVPPAASYNLALVLTEDSVHGTSVNYAQRNAYSGGSWGPMANSSIDFVAQPDPVPAALMYYMNVAREILPGYKGDDASLPDSLYADSMYTYSFPTFTVPAGYNANKMRAIVLLIDTVSGQIKNANGADIIGSTVSVNDVASNSPFLSVYPNPFANTANVRFNVSQSGRFTVKIYDYLGKELKTLFDGDAVAGRTYDLRLNGDNLAEGVYFCTLNGNGINQTRKLQIVK